MNILLIVEFDILMIHYWSYSNPLPPPNYVNHQACNSYHIMSRQTNLV